MDEICFEKFFYENSFDTKKGIYEISKEILDSSVKNQILFKNDDLYRCGILLTKEQEQKLFRKYNYLKYRIQKIKKWSSSGKKNREIKKKTDLLIEIREILIKCNTRLMIKPVVKFSSIKKIGSTECDDLSSDAYVYMLKSIDRFDYRKGFKFSTYFSTVLYRNLSRDKKLKQNKRKYHGQTIEKIDDLSFTEQYEDQKNIYNKKFIESLFSKLKSDKKGLTILKKYYGVCGEKQHTLRQLSEILGTSTETIRQIKMKTELLIKNKVELEYDPIF